MTKSMTRALVLPLLASGVLAALPVGSAAAETTCVTVSTKGTVVGVHSAGHCEETLLPHQYQELHSPETITQAQVIVEVWYP
ncbi:MAG: hypothetical protein QOE45_178 [Frankiaceae bacterium]|jgi:hypothetical protein|nr:hypothetical protein [Frankiaceae bacterium]